MAYKRAHKQILKYLQDNPGWNKIGNICKQLNIEPHSFGRYAYALDEVERYEDNHKEVYYRLKE